MQCGGNHINWFNTRLTAPPKNIGEGTGFVCSKPLAKNRRTLLFMLVVFEGLKLMFTFLTNISKIL